MVPDEVRGVLGLPYYADIATTAERGLMDAVFLADNLAIAEYRVTHLPRPSSTRSRCCRRWPG